MQKRTSKKALLGATNTPIEQLLTNVCAHEKNRQGRDSWNNLGVCLFIRPLIITGRHKSGRPRMLIVLSNKAASCRAFTLQNKASSSGFLLRRRAFVNDTAVFGNTRCSQSGERHTMSTLTRRPGLGTSEVALKGHQGRRSTFSSMTCACIGYLMTETKIERILISQNRFLNDANLWTTDPQKRSPSYCDIAD